MAHVWSRSPDGYYDEEGHEDQEEQEINTGDMKRSHDENGEDEDSSTLPNPKQLRRATEGSLDETARTRIGLPQVSTPVQPPNETMYRASSLKLEEATTSAPISQGISLSSPEQSNDTRGLDAIGDNENEDSEDAPLDDYATTSRVTSIEKSVLAMQATMESMQENLKNLTNKSNTFPTMTQDIPPKKTKPWSPARANFIARRLFSHSQRSMSAEEGHQGVIEDGHIGISKPKADRCAAGLCRGDQDYDSCLGAD